MPNLTDRFLRVFPDDVCDGDLILEEQGNFWLRASTINGVRALLLALRRYRLADRALVDAGLDPTEINEWSTDEEIALANELRDAEVALLEAYDA